MGRFLGGNRLQRLTPLRHRTPDPFCGGYRTLMAPHVSHCTHPPDEMRIERLPAREGQAFEGLELQRAHAALYLAIGPRPVGAAGPQAHAPVVAEGREFGAKDGTIASQRRTRLCASTMRLVSGFPPKGCSGLSRPSSL